MTDEYRIPERRIVARAKINYPATYTGFDERRNPCDSRIVKVTEVSLIGVRLQSSSPIESGEILDITLALEDNLVSFRGKLIHATPFGEDAFHLGISIDCIEDEQRVTLIRFFSRIWQLNMD
jgi:hypothetical protein